MDKAGIRMGSRGVLLYGVSQSYLTGNAVGWHYTIIRFLQEEPSIYF